jgi:GTP pyrophosphokinase
LDFAFDIHTEVGGSCLGAKINNKLVPLNTKLKNGDQVEILTSSKQKPNEGWLKMVVSAKAIASIKDYLKEEKKLAASQGKEVVVRKLKQIKQELNNDTINRLTAYFGSKTPLDFFYEVGTGRIDAKDIKKIGDMKSEVTRRAKKKLNSPEEIIEASKKASETNKDLLLIGDDMDLVEYKYANCCKPIPGDDVFGFVTVSDGIKIHRTSCPNATELMSNYGYRIIKAKWTSKQEIAFLAGIKVIGTDRMGMIKDISELISNDLKVNMRSLTIDTDNGIFEGSIQLYVDDTSHLNKLIKKMTKIEGIESVNRYDIFDD